MPAIPVTSPRALKMGLPHEGLLTLEQAANYLQVAAGTLKHWVASRRIDHVKVGKFTRFTKEMLDRYIAAQTVAASAEGR